MGDDSGRWRYACWRGDFGCVVICFNMFFDDIIGVFLSRVLSGVLGGVCVNRVFNDFIGVFAGVLSALLGFIVGGRFVSEPFWVRDVALSA